MMVVVMTSWAAGSNMLQRWERGICTGKLLIILSSMTHTQGPWSLSLYKTSARWPVAGSGKSYIINTVFLEMLPTFKKTIEA